MRVLSLFDGISCARVALDRAGIKVESYKAAEIDKYAIQISKKNYNDIEHVGSVVGLHVNEKVDLLVGGSPCQDLSISKNNRKGLQGERSVLIKRNKTYLFCVGECCINEQRIKRDNF
jgi:site-specific DNA-cytosine methylase